MSESVATLEQEIPVAQETRAETPADAAPPPESQEVEAPLIESGEAYFEATFGGKEGQAEAPEPTRTGADYLKLLSEDKRRDYRNVHAKTQTEIDSFRDLLIDAGVAPGLAEHLTKTNKDRVNELYAASLGLAGYESAALVQAAEQNQVLAAVQKALPADIFADFRQNKLAEITKSDTPTTAVVEAAIQAAIDHTLKGYLPKKAVKTAYDDGFKAGRAQAERVANGASSKPLGVNGTAPSASNEPKNLAEAEQMHAGMHPSGRQINNAEMRAYQARFNKGN